MITETHVEEMKGRLKLFHSYENDHIQKLLEQSYADISYRCGVFNMKSDIRGAELVFERTRYAYNDSLEFFNENYLTNITSFAIENMEAIDYDNPV